MITIILILTTMHACSLPASVQVHAMLHAISPIVLPDGAQGQRLQARLQGDESENKTLSPLRYFFSLILLNFARFHHGRLARARLRNP